LKHGAAAAVWRIASSSPCGVPKTPRTKQIAAAAPWTARSPLPLLGPQPAAARWTRKTENILE
jgi:hypothetical protein